MLPSRSNPPAAMRDSAFLTTAAPVGRRLSDVFDPADVPVD
jgi:hypothetical protein